MLRAELVEALEESFDVRHTGTVAQFNIAFAQFKPQLTVLDLGLPDGRGADVIRALRSDAAKTGILVLSGQKHEADRVVALELGADDFLTKPCGPRELVARCHAILRRVEALNAAPAQDEICFAGYRLDLSGMQVTDPNGVPLSLTTAEFELLRFMARNPGRVFSREQITRELRGDNWAGYDRTVDGLMYRLRRKLKGDDGSQQFLKTVHGAGYVFSANVEIT